MQALLKEPHRRRSMQWMRRRLRWWLRRDVWRAKRLWSHTPPRSRGFARPLQYRSESFAAISWAFYSLVVFAGFGALGVLVGHGPHKDAKGVEHAFRAVPAPFRAIAVAL